MSKIKYYRPAIPKSIAKAIEELFEKFPYISNYFDGNKVKFIEDGIRRHIIYFEEMKKAGAKYDSD